MTSRLAPLLLLACILTSTGCDTFALWPKEPPKFGIYDEDNQPLVTDDDIIVYRWPSHTMIVASGVRDRLAATKPGRFHVVAQGQTCYEGHIATGLSSTSSSGVFILNLLIKPDETNRIVLELGYPAPWAHQGPDPRPDPRIKEALTLTGKLRLNDYATGTE